MAKRKSALEHAILDLEDQIAALELARNALIRLRIVERPAPAKPRPAPRAAARPVPTESAS